MDLIMSYNMIHGFISDAACPAILFCPDERTRGHDLKLSTILAHRDYRKFCFSNGVVHSWNSFRKKR